MLFPCKFASPKSIAFALRRWRVRHSTRRRPPLCERRTRLKSDLRLGGIVVPSFLLEGELVVRQPSFPHPEDQLSFLGLGSTSHKFCPREASASSKQAKKAVKLSADEMKVLESAGYAWIGWIGGRSILSRGEKDWSSAQTGGQGCLWFCFYTFKVFKQNSRMHVEVFPFHEENKLFKKHLSAPRATAIKP